MISINRLFILRKRLSNYIRQFGENVGWKVESRTDNDKSADMLEESSYKPEYPNKKTLDENLATYEKLLQYQANVNIALAKANASGPSEVIAKIGSAKTLKNIYEGLEYHQSNFKKEEVKWDTTAWDRTVEPPVRGANITIYSYAPSTTDFKAAYDKQCKIVRDLEDELNEKSSTVDVEKFLDKETLDFLNSL